MTMIWRYRPNFVEAMDDTQESAEFATVEDLMAIPWVVQFAQMKDFSRFSLETGNILMAECEGGRVWLVVGFLDGPFDLPKWVPVREQK